MPTTLSNGYKKPQTGDRGAVVFDALEDDIERLNDHSHNGTDSEVIQTRYLTKGSVTLALASWAAVAGQTGTYRQLLTVPAGHTVDAMVAKFYVGSGSEAGAILFPTVEKVSATTAYVYINDNTIDVKVSFG